MERTSCCARRVVRRTGPLQTPGTRTDKARPAAHGRADIRIGVSVTSANL